MPLFFMEQRMNKIFNVKNRYKILPLDNWMIYGQEEDEHEMFIRSVGKENQIEPIFNRNGFYFDRFKKFYWFEVNGTAWKYSRDAKGTFNYKMNVVNLSERVYREKVMNAIKLLIKEGIADKNLIAKYKLSKERIEWHDFMLSLLKEKLRWSKEID
jgi:hypothetical protein